MIKDSKLLITGCIAGIALFFSACSPTNDANLLVQHYRDSLAGDPRENVFDISCRPARGQELVLYGETDNPLLKSHLADSLAALGFEVIDSVVVLPSDVSASWGLTTLSVANLRARPVFSSELVSQAIMGTPIKILREEEGWTYVQTPDRYLGWLPKSSFAGKSAAEMDRWRNSPRVMVTSHFSLVVQPGSGIPVSDVVPGSILEVRGRQDDLWVVALPDGRSGTLSRSDALLFESWLAYANVHSDSLRSTAVKMTGRPYLWGGTSVKGLDCSGFTKTIYFLNGIILARDASLQVKHGLEISTDAGWQELETGDLLFFAPRPASERITHVGMYIGDSEFIHSAGRVQINSLDSIRENFSPHRARTLKSVRRIAGAEPSKGIVPVAAHDWYTGKPETVQHFKNESR